MTTSILDAIVSTYHLRKGNGRFTGPCPKCGGGSDSNKFVIRDDCGFKCYGCGWKGDVITWLKEMKGMTCPEAHEAAAKECAFTACAVYGTCRMGDGTGRKIANRVRRSVTPVETVRVTVLPVPTETTPKTIWTSWASGMVDSASSSLPDQDAVLIWLDGRGIDPESATRFRLGWLDHDRKIDRASIGLPNRADGKTTIWIPGGLLIPIFDANGTILRIRVRRTNAARDKFLHDLKYVWIEGSGNGPMVLRPQGINRGTVVVESELDAMACAAAHNQVTVIAIGSVSTGIPAPLRFELEQSPVILVALDADGKKEGKKGAGPDAIAAWSNPYRQARFWPVPAGKDPGEYAVSGGDLHTWIESGLIPELTAPSSHDLRLYPECPQQGDGGEDAVLEDEYRIITLIDGRELYVTDSEPLWHKLTMAGKIVFSVNELKRLKLACKGMSDSQASQASLLAVDIKETFVTSYIRDGRAEEEIVDGIR